ncbi:unnamed protein product [Rhizophagus irregularis]|nr:unnamed protein product [Rhizophagus irregularis]
MSPIGIFFHYKKEHYCDCFTTIFCGRKKNISKVNFLNVKLLRCSSIDVRTRYYAIEPRLNAEYKRFNVNTGVITKLRDTLEAFAHFTYEYTEGYLVVCDLQGIELIDEFLLTDPAIHCIDPLRFGGTIWLKKELANCSWQIIDAMIFVKN